MINSIHLKFESRIANLLFATTGVVMLSLSIVVYGWSFAPRKGIKPLIVLEDQNRPSINFDGTRVVAIPEIGRADVFNVDSRTKLFSLNLPELESAAISGDGSEVIVFHEDLGKVEPMSHTGKFISVYSLYKIDTQELVRKGQTKVFHCGKFLRDFVGVYNQGGSNSTNITSDLSVVAMSLPQIQLTTNDELNNTVIVVTRLRDQSVEHALKPDDGVMEGGRWHNVGITPDGRYVVSSRLGASSENKSRTVVWGVMTGKVVFSVPFYCHWLSISDDGTTLATYESSGRRGIEIWNIAKGEKTSTLTEKTNAKLPPIKDGVLSPDGKLLATTISENILLWDTGNGRIIASQDQSKYSHGNVKSIVFSGNGKRIAVGSDAEVVTVWSLDEIMNKARLGKVKNTVAQRFN